MCFLRSLRSASSRTAILAWALSLLLSQILLAEDRDDVRYPREASGGLTLMPDPAAHDGIANGCVVGTAAPGKVLFGFASFSPAAGVYEMTCRLKVMEQRPADGVCAIFGAPDRTQLEIKGTDFTAAGQWQEMSFSFEKKQQGGRMDLGLHWTGKASVFVDFCSLRLKHAWTDSEWAQRNNYRPFAGTWSFPSPSRPRVLIAKGLWWEFFGLRETPAWMQAVATSAWYSGPAGELSPFPKSAEEMMSYNLILLADIDAYGLTPEQRFLLQEYVQGGGAVMFFGGIGGFGMGNYAKTSLADWLPCLISDEPDRQSLGAGAVLTPTKDAADLLPGDLAWQQHPLVFYRHNVKPREGTRILMNAGDLPVLMVRDLGKGHVAAFCATPEGDPSDDQLAFWEWGDLGRCIAAVASSLFRGQSAVDEPFNANRDGAVLLKISKALAAGEDVAARVELQRLVRRCHGKVFARTLLEYISALVDADALDGEKKELPYAVVREIAGAVRPYVGAEFKPLAEGLMASSNAGKRSLGLWLAAKVKHPQAKPLLPGLARTGRASEDNAKLTGDVPALSVDAPLVQRLIAVQAIADLGDASLANDLAKISREFESQRPQIKETFVIAIDRRVQEEIYLHSLLGRLRLGDVVAVKPFCDSYLELCARKDWNRNYLDADHNGEDPKKVKIGMERSTFMVNLEARRLAELEGECALLPPAVQNALAGELAARSDPHVVSLAYAALGSAGGGQPNADSALALVPMIAKGTLRELRDLAFSLMAQSHDAKAHDALAAAAAQLAVSGEADDAYFALSHLSNLPAARRQGILDAASASSDPRVKKLVRHSRLLATQN